jgi:hypothetical protein
MRFSDFLRTTVLMSAGSATVLATVTVAGAANNGDATTVPFAAGWWVGAGLIGIWLGRRAETSSPIASLLASARTQASLPEVNPARTILNRLWPLLISTVGAGALAFLVPQVPDRGARRGAVLHRPDFAAQADPARPHAGLPL